MCNYRILKYFMLIIVVLAFSHCAIAFAPITIPASIAIRAHNESKKQQTFEMLKNPNMLDEVLAKEEDNIINKINNDSNPDKIDSDIDELLLYVRLRVNRHQFSRALELNAIRMKTIDKYFNKNIIEIADCKLWDAKINYINNNYDKSIDLCKQIINMIGESHIQDVGLNLIISSIIRDETYSLLGHNYLAKKYYAEAGHYLDKLISYANVIQTRTYRSTKTEKSSDSDEVEKVTSFGKEEKVFKEAISRSKLVVNSGFVDYYLATGNPEEALNILNDPNYLTPIQNLRDMTDLKLRSAEISFIDSVIFWHFRMAFTLDALGRREEAARFALEAITMLDRVRFTVPFDISSAVMQGYHSNLFINYYKSAIRIMVAQIGKIKEKDNFFNDNNLFAASFLCAEVIKAQYLIGSLINKYRESSPPSLSNELAKKEKMLLNEYWQINHNQHYEIRYPPTQDFENRIQLYQSFFNNFRIFIDELYSKAPNYAMNYYSRPLRPTEVPLKNDEILIEYVIDEKSIYLFKLERNKKEGPSFNVSIEQLEVNPEELEYNINKYIGLIKDRSAINSDYIYTAKGLYDNLFGNTLKTAPAQSKLIIIPDGILGLLPFEALVIQGGKDYRDNVYLADKFQITYWQSSSFMALMRKSSPISKPMKTLFALGNPIIKGEESLKGSEEEVRNISDLFDVKPNPPDVLLGPLATVGEFNKVALNEYRYLHFATHCKSKNGEPCLLLSNEINDKEGDHYIRPSDVMNWQLNTDMAVLSACSTGMGNKQEGEGLINFAWAFHFAGARSVIIGLWEVRDKVAKEFMNDFYKNIKNGANNSEALKIARKNIKNSFPRPYYWAPFILHGQR